MNSSPVATLTTRVQQLEASLQEVQAAGDTLERSADFDESEAVRVFDEAGADVEEVRIDLRPGQRELSDAWCG